MKLLPNERACLIALKTLGSPATWAAITTAAREPKAQPKNLLWENLIINVGRLANGNGECYSITQKGLEECDGK